MQALHFFAGAGGSLLAGDLLGWKHVVAAETDPFCRAVLAARWPGCELLGDVATEPWERFAGVDLVVGRWPCQPVSSAGKRLASADHRDGWPGLARAVRLTRPRFLFLENVAAVLTAERGRYWGRCLADLAALGYGARWTVLRASDAGAPHRRERLWCLAWRVADADMLGCERRPLPGGESAGESPGLPGAQGDHEGAPESGLGLRLDGLASKIPGDRLAAHEKGAERAERHEEERFAWPGASGVWPTGRGQGQEAWEPARTCGRVPLRRQQLKALGNGWVPAQAVLAWRILTGEAD